MFADGFTHGYGGRFTYDRWDGHTVDIDPENKTITRKYASVNLLAQDVLVQVARKVEAKGGVVICNSYPGTRTVHRENVLYCIESASGDVQLVRLHLVPGVLALGNHVRLASGNIRDLYDDIRSKLHYGGLYFYYGDKEIPHAMPTTRMFPITPTELHEGWVKGKERIVTSVPGVYGWPGEHNLQAVYLWDGRGVPVAHNYTTTVDASGVRTQLDLKPCETAIVEHIPVKLNTSATVNVLIHEYDVESIMLALNGIGEVEIIIKDGLFKVLPDLEYACQITNREVPVAVNTDECIHIALELNGTECIKVSHEKK